MKKIGNKEEILVYGEDTIPFLQHIIDGLSNNSIQSSTYSIDFFKLKKLKISFMSKKNSRRHMLSARSNTKKRMIF